MEYIILVSPNPSAVVVSYFANCVHTADATQLDSFVASAVCIGHKAGIVTAIDSAK